ncbi:MAG: SRPBCC domain-containing protein [Myxococcota bacterium]
MSVFRRDLHLKKTFPHPREKVWRALTDPALLSRWLMENDFEAKVGHRFNFRTEPGPGFDGVVDCEVLEVEAPSRLVYSWKGGPIDTVVTYELLETGTGTEMRFSQTGFDGLRAFAVSFILSGGWKKLDRRLRNLLNSMD